MFDFANLSSILSTLSVAAVLYVISKGIYNVYLCPIAHVPGPKLAALTYLYQSYFDVYPYQGRWLFQQIELHKQYGPVVRVGPDEIHIDDPDFYTEFAGTSTKRRDKSTTWYWFSGMKTVVGLSGFATLDHDLHVMRRSAMNGFFSTRRVQQLEERIRGHVKKMTDRLLDYKATGETINLLYLTSALTLDVISEYSFGKSVSSLDTPDLGGPIRRQLESGVQMHPIARQFRMLFRFMMEFMVFGSKHLGVFKEFSRFTDMIMDLTAPAYKKALQDGDDGKGALETSIVEAMVHSNTLPPEEKTMIRIQAEAGNLIGAGTETTARTVSTHSNKDTVVLS